MFRLVSWFQGISLFLGYKNRKAAIVPDAIASRSKPKTEN